MLARLLIAIAFILSFLLGFSESTPESSFAAANEAYDNQQYDSSLVLYQSIMDEGYSSPELFQNMGTSAYKLDLIPEAVYYFEKGLKLSPGNDDLIHNLELANERVVDRSTIDNRSGISAWLSNTLGGNADFWGGLGVIASILGASLVLLYVFTTSKLFKKMGLTAGIISWVFTIAFVVIAYLQHGVSTSEDFGILFEPSIEVRNDPSEAASIAFVLHEGSKLRILDANENWYKVSFGEGKVGWLPKDSIKII
jgi:hypothetical protein